MYTIRTTDSDKLPEFKDEIPLHFGDGKCYKRKSTDSLKLTKLEDIFKEIPKD